MNQFLIRKGSLQGKIAIPASKSQTLRAILFASFAKGLSRIRHYLPSPDTQAMIDACRSFGAQIKISSDEIEIQGMNGQFSYTEDVINAGNSGIVLRFCAAVGALAHHPVVITGDHSIRHQRPMKALLDGLSQLGVSVSSMRGDHYAPVIIRGPLQAGKAVLNGEDSQPVSALLIASTFAEGPIELLVKNPGEKPWVGLTLGWLDRLGVVYENHGFERYCLLGDQRYQGFDYEVPGDFSSAAFPIAAALVTNSDVLLNNIDMQDSQGDKEVIGVLRKMGALIEIDEEQKSLRVKKGSALQGVKVDINNFIDAITILAVVACFAEGETHIYNAAIAKRKECNRIHCIVTELRKMGANIQETEDGLCVQKSSLKGALVHSYQDHRMAMSLAVAALGAEGETKISSVDCVSKTFPTFMNDFNQLGAQIRGLV
jgi:3-phosphoshikimate 1-carboxyvinyltransferase